MRCMRRWCGGEGEGMTKEETSSVQASTFLASFPCIQSAIKIGPDGMRIQLDIPESEMGEAVKLLAWRDQVLQVTIAPQSR